MKLSVVILNYNVRHFLELCLQSVMSAVKDIDSEIIVVDNKSSDDSCAMVKVLFPNVKLIKNQENLGFSKGNNIGAQIARGKYICILNPDTIVPEDAFIKLLDFADSKDNLGVLGCQFIDGTGRFLPESKRNVPTPLIALKKVFGTGSRYYSHLSADAIGKVDVLAGAFMLMKSSVYKSVDGFDEDFFMYGEDIDLSYRVLKKGFTNWYYGKMSIIHFKGESTIKDEIYAKRFYGAMRLFYDKHFKSNVFFNIVVLLGVRLAPILQVKKASKTKQPSKSVVISSRLGKDLKAKLPHPVDEVSTIEHIENNTLIVLDTEKLSYNQVISILKMNKISTNATFRIWPKKANFILGSDTSVSRGDIIRFS